VVVNKGGLAHWLNVAATVVVAAVLFLRPGPSGPAPKPDPAPAVTLESVAKDVKSLSARVSALESAPKPEPPPPAPSPLAKAAKGYMAAQSASLRSAAADVRAGRVSPGGLPTVLKNYRLPASKALADAIESAPDQAAALDQAADVMEGK
jgi:hypothetical protein